MANQYKFYADIGGNTIEFPVNPQEYTVSYPTDHSTYNVLDAGEIMVPRKPSLMEVSWESYFPGKGSDLLLMGHRWEAPGSLVAAIKGAMDSASVCSLVISRFDADGSRMHDTNISALITDFETTERGGEAGDIYYSITWKEYRCYAPIKITLPKANGKENKAQKEEKPREVMTPELRVGATVIANGIYYSSSYGDKPTGTANNLKTTVSRIIQDASRPYPVLIGGNRGWIKAAQLQVTG